MLGLVIVTHGKFGEALLVATQHFVGPLSYSATVTISHHDDMSVRRTQIADAAKLVDQGSGTLIVTDLFGGAPSNLAISLMSDRIDVVAGANLAGMIKFAGSRELPLPDAALAVREATRRYVTVASEILNPDQEVSVVRTFGAMCGLD